MNQGQGGLNFVTTISLNPSTCKMQHQPGSLFFVIQTQGSKGPPMGSEGPDKWPDTLEPA